jgi:hypothetical protein
VDNTIAAIPTKNVGTAALGCPFERSSMRFFPFILFPASFLNPEV